MCVAMATPISLTLRSFQPRPRSLQMEQMHASPSSGPGVYFRCFGEISVLVRSFFRNRFGVFFSSSSFFSDSTLVLKPAGSILWAVLAD